MSNRSWRTSLSCLVHPATLGSIALLLLNDHVLKGAAPSLLTGKLSDLAGVFFFPFLLAAVVSLVVEWWARPRPATLGLVAIGITGAWFTLLKLSPLANAWTCGLLSALWGGPVVLLLDATDLVALVMLWPAWRLWRRESARAPDAPPRRLAWAALAVATMATVATSPARDEVALRVVAEDGNVYALTQTYALMAGQEPAEWGRWGAWEAYRTTDNGRTWEALTEIPAGVQALAEEELAVPVSDPTNPAIQYRLPGDGTVARSNDSGRTWETAWAVPPGRREFMVRYKRNPLRHYPGPHDMAFTPDGSGTLIVAAGTEGVLVKDPAGAWTAHAVGYARPAPARTFDPFLWPDMVGPELNASLALAALVAVALTIYGLAPALSMIEQRDSRKRVRWVRRPALVVGIIAALVYLFVLFVYAFAPWPGAAAIIFYGVIVLSQHITWSRAAFAAGKPTPAQAARPVWLATMGLLFLVGTVPWVLWATGIVAWHRTAVVMAIAGGLAGGGGGRLAGASAYARYSGTITS